MRDEPRDSREGIRDFTRRRRRLPHWEGPGATYFVTFRVREEADCDLSRPDIAPIILGALHHFADTRYLLFDHTVMPDHVHVILKPVKRCDETWESLSGITHSIKSWTANQINDSLRRRGSLWQDESYDHIIRDRRDYHARSRYIWLNPVTAGLVNQPDEWPWWGNR